MNLDEVQYKRKVSLSFECGSVSGGDCTKQALTLNFISKKIRYRRLLTEQQLLERMEKGKFPGYVQCNNETPKNSRS